MAYSLAAIILLERAAAGMEVPRIDVTGPSHGSDCGYELALSAHCFAGHSRSRTDADNGPSIGGLCTINRAGDTLLVTKPMASASNWVAVVNYSWPGSYGGNDCHDGPAE